MNWDLSCRKQECDEKEKPCWNKELTPPERETAIDVSDLSDGRYRLEKESLLGEERGGGSLNRKNKGR